MVIVVHGQVLLTDQVKLVVREYNTTGRKLQLQGTLYSSRYSNFGSFPEPVKVSRLIKV
jgi:hypothetical protein